jgi:hypothetical protein
MNRFFGNKQAKKASALMQQHALLDDEDDDFVLRGGDDNSDVAFPNYRPPPSSLQFSVSEIEKSFISPPPSEATTMENIRNVRRHKSSDGAEILSSTRAITSPSTSPSRASRRFSSPERQKPTVSTSNISKAFLPILKGRRLGKGSAKPEVMPSDPPSSDLFSQLTFSEPFTSHHMLSPEKGVRGKVTSPASETFTATEWDPSTDFNASFRPVEDDEPPNSPSRRPKLKFTISSGPLAKHTKPSLVSDPAAILPKSTAKDLFQMDHMGDANPFVWQENEKSNVDWIAAETDSAPHVDKNVKPLLELLPNDKGEEDAAIEPPSDTDPVVNAPSPPVQTTSPKESKSNEDVAPPGKPSESPPHGFKEKKSKEEVKTPNQTPSRRKTLGVEPKESMVPTTKELKTKTRKESKTPVRSRSIEAGKSEDENVAIKTKSKKLEKEPKTPTRKKDADDMDPKTPSRIRDASAENEDAMKVTKSKDSKNKEKDPKTPSKKEPESSATLKTPKPKESKNDVSTPKKKEKRSKTPLPSDSKMRGIDLSCEKNIALDKPPKSPSKGRSSDKDHAPKSPKRTVSSERQDDLTQERVAPSRAESRSRRRHSETEPVAQEKSVMEIANRSAHQEKIPSKSKEPKTPKNEANCTNKSDLNKVTKVPKGSKVEPAPSEIAAHTSSHRKSKSPKKKPSAINAAEDNRNDSVLSGNDITPKFLLSNLDENDLKVPEIFSIDEDVPEWVNKAYTMIENFRVDSALSGIQDETLSEGSCSSVSTCADKLATNASMDNPVSQELAGEQNDEDANHAIMDDGLDDKLSSGRRKELEVDNVNPEEPENVWITLKVEAEEPSNAPIQADNAVSNRLDETGNAENVDTPPAESPPMQPVEKTSFPVFSVSKRDTAPTRSVSNDLVERSFVQDATTKRSKSHDIDPCIIDPMPVETGASEEKQTIASETRLASASLPKVSYPSISMSKRDTTPTRRSFSNDMQKHFLPLYQNKKEVSNNDVTLKKEDIVLTGNKDRFRELRRLAKLSANEPVSSEDEADLGEKVSRRVGSKKPDRLFDNAADVEPVTETPKRRKNRNSTTFRNLRRLAKRAANEPLSDDDETVHNGTAALPHDEPPTAPPDALPAEKASTTKRSTVRLSRQRSAPIVERFESKHLDAQKVFLHGR